MRSSRSMLITSLAVLILGPVLALANGFYTPTVGPRAGAMGGAFVGLADDYSAIYWNPAGITQIKGMELTATGHDVVALASRRGFVRFYGEVPHQQGDRFALADIAATSQTSNRVAPGVFFLTDAGPLRSVFDKVGIAAYTLTEYGSEWSGNDVFSEEDFLSMEGVPGDLFFTERKLVADMQDYESRMKTYVLSPILAKEVLPGLSVGVTANLAYSHFTLTDVYMDRDIEVTETPAGYEYKLQITPVQHTDDVTGWGYGATMGVLYRVGRQFSAGVTVRSPMTMAYEGTFGLLVSGGGEANKKEQHDLDFEMRFPTWIGAGFAYRDLLFDGLTMTGDVQWTDWSTFENINRNIAWAANSAFTEGFQEGLDTTDLDWEDTVEVAVGFEYRLKRSLSLNLGYRNSPSPAPDITYNFIMPQSAKNVMGLGVTYRQDFWLASFGLEYHAGDKREIAETEDMNGKHVDDLLIPSLAFTYAF